ncbi:hypothetical protein ZIOFF_072490 [Zingiber officinale]|uniref:Retrovirus-related Pol polyprotein from transposon TNT 1-94-like beta-barrel domain-containing protein n=1 Tax=Zingiber officinale TaxID=94328 RepID=A0A8J5E9J9_ZINOF|nr:hypothetical protein ZIOFF_072490 [Zingiber officinale]
MENFLRSKEYWDLVETRIPVAVEGVELTEAQGKLFADQKLKDLKLEEKEELLLMSYVKLDQAMQEVREDVWFLDSGCSNHMCAHKEWFSDLDEEFRTSVKLGNNSTMTVMGKGNIMLQIVGATQVLQNPEGIYISQRKYAKDVSEKFGMEKSNSVKNPIVPGAKLTKDEEGSKIFGKSNGVTFASCEKGTKILKRNCGLGVFYQNEGNGELMAYRDSDYARDTNDRKTTSGYVFFA